jgi:hypothetical protein
MFGVAPMGQICRKGSSIALVQLGSRNDHVTVCIIKIKKLLFLLND